MNSSQIKRMTEQTGISAMRIRKALEINNNVPDQKEVEDLDILVEQIELCTIAKEARKIYANINEGSEAEAAVILKWDSLSMRDIKKASTVEEIQDVYRCTRDGSKVKDIAILKWVELCTTAEEVREAWLFACNESEAENAAIIKWDSLSIQDIEKVSTIEEAEEVYGDTREGSKVKVIAALRWIGLCTTIEEAREAYEYTYDEGVVEDAAILKWVELCTTVEETQEAYENARDESEAETAAILKLATFFE